MIDLIETSILTGDLVIPRDLDVETMTDGLFIAPQMPWIDPQKEADAYEKLEQAGLASGPEIIRRRGRNPLEVFESEKRWRQRWGDVGLSITTDPGSIAAQSSQPKPETEPNAKIETAA